ncbi:MAG: SurA N-terminal domain-containing protein [Coriobacteriales bacterium]|nr:SurA N-terminal domain-containing protein [Coriobacteriales bacterium]
MALLHRPSEPGRGIPHAAPRAAARWFAGKPGAAAGLLLSLALLLSLLLALLVLPACSNDASDAQAGAEGLAVGEEAEDLVAATVNSTEIRDSEIDLRIAQTRAGDPSLASDEEWADWLLASGYSIASYRERVLGELIDDALIHQAALENGIIITDEDVKAALADIKRGYASEKDWLAALERMGYSEAQYRDETKTALFYQQLQSVIDDSYPDLADLEDPADKLATYMGRLRELADIEVFSVAGAEEGTTEGSPEATTETTEE